MSFFYVFKYSFNVRNGPEEISTHAVAMLPAEACTVLLGGGSSWVHHFLHQGVDTYLLDGDLTCLEGPEAAVHAQELQKILTERGTIASDPRVPAASEKGKLKVVK